jgi:hypothetical protein
MLEPQPVLLATEWKRNMQAAEMNVDMEFQIRFSCFGNGAGSLGVDVRALQIPSPSWIDKHIKNHSMPHG